MRMSKFKLTIVVVLAVISAAPASADPLDDAVAAEHRDDCSAAVPIYRALAAKGIVQAYKRLGYFSEIGYCAKRDWVDAAKWYGKAIAAGDEGSAGSLGHIGRNWRFMYRNTPMDPIIYELIEKAAQSGSAVAQFSLGVMNYAIGDPSFDESKGNLGEP
jgi:TPR repeat protein